MPPTETVHREKSGVTQVQQCTVYGTLTHYNLSQGIIIHREKGRGGSEREEIASPWEWGNHGWRTATDILPPRRMRGPRAREASELPARVRQSGAIRQARPPSQAGQATQPSGPGQPARCVRRAGLHQRDKADGPGQLARWRRRAGSTRPGTRRRLNGSPGGVVTGQDRLLSV